MATKRRGTLEEAIIQKAIEDLQKRSLFGDSVGEPARRGRGASSVQELMGEDPLLSDYEVDITRTPIDPTNLDLGWNKKVTRTRMKREDDKKRKR
jgi:hypothetical protein